MAECSRPKDATAALSRERPTSIRLAQQLSRVHQLWLGAIGKTAPSAYANRQGSCTIFLTVLLGKYGRHALTSSRARPTSWLSTLTSST